MEFIQQQKEYVKAKPIAVGVCTVLATLSLGMALSFALGFTSPLAVFAQAAPCPCGGGVGGGIGGTPLPGGGIVLLPGACTLKVDDSVIAPGGSTNLSWETTAAIDFKIDGFGDKSPNGGSITVSPAVTTTYTGYARGTDLAWMPCTVTVTVVPPPKCTLSAAPASITKGGSSQLNWTTSDATSFTIDGVAVASSAVASGNKTVQPTATVTYTGIATGIGGTSAPCTATVTVTNPPPTHITPSCTLSALPTSITTGDTSKLSWTTTNGSKFSIDNGVGIVTPTAGGDTSVKPSVTTTYTGTVTSSTNDTATCTATITVTPPTPGSPSCTLSASPTSITKGDSSKLSWTTSNASQFSIDQGVGIVTPTDIGNTLVSPTATTTYTGTATSLDGKTTVTCTAKIVVNIPSTPSAPTCTLSASPTNVKSGDTSKLSWTTTNAKTFVINQGVGAVTPLASGSASTSAITSDTTFTGTVTSADGQTATCTAAVTVPPPSGLACTLTAADSSVSPGGKTSLTWTTNGASTFSLDNGVGIVTPTAGGSTTTQSINNDIVYNGTATAADGTTATCTVTITVTTPGCRSGCGGGGGGGHPVNVTLDTAPTQPLAFVYLSQIPYTGLDLGPIGTFLYWLLLALWSAALAYLAIFKLVPFLKRRMQGFGAAVSEALNAEVPEDDRRYAYAAPAAQRAPEAVPAQPVMRSAAPAPEAASTYSAYQGFKSFGRDGALTIDDIVKGLSRQKSVHQAPAANVEPVYEHVEEVNDRVEPIYENVEEIAPTAQRPAGAARSQASKAAPAPAAEVPAFLALVLAGDRDGAFSMIRSIVREGGDAESFLTQVAVALDDAYRARLDGTPVHGEIARVTDGCATGFLEKLVAAFSTGVDSTYSQGITGAKLAVARALGVVEG